MSSLSIFATTSDLIGLVEAVETKRAIVYTEAGNRESPSFAAYRFGRKIPNLGVSSTGSQLSERSFLISDATEPLQVREVPQKRGGLRYAVDQLVNRNTILFQPSGLLEKDNETWIIMGRVTTISTTRESTSLFKLFANEIKRRFTNVKANWLGTEAVSLFEQGARLTQFVGRAREFDLTRD